MLRVYKILRDIIFGLVLTIVFLYVLIYVLLSSPWMQQKITERLTQELSYFLGSEVSIESLDIIPFNEVIINGLEVKDPAGNDCIRVNKVGAGINLTALLFEWKIDVTYAEVLGLKASLRQENENAPWNIDFIIKAFSPKKEKQEKTKFDLDIKNIVLRDCEFSIDRAWQPGKTEKGKIDFNHFRIINFRTDMSLPRLSDEEIKFDIRRMSFDLAGLMQIEKIAMEGSVSPEFIDINNTVINFGKTSIRPGDIHIDLEGQNIKNIIESEGISLLLRDNVVIPSDLAFIFPQLKDFTEPFKFTLMAKTNLSYFDLNLLKIGSPAGFSLQLSGEIGDLKNIKESSINLEEFSLSASENFISRVLKISDRIPDKIRKIASKAGNIKIEAAGNTSSLKQGVDGWVRFNSKIAEVDLNLDSGDEFHNIKTSLEARISDLGFIIDREETGELVFNLAYEGRIEDFSPEAITGKLEMDIEKSNFKTFDLNNISITLEKDQQMISGSLNADNSLVKANLDYDIYFPGKFEGARLDCQLDRLDLSQIGATGKFEDSELSGLLDFEIQGSKVEELTGDAYLNDLCIKNKEGIIFNLKNLSVNVVKEEMGTRLLSLDSDFLEAQLEGRFTINELILSGRKILSSVFPSLITLPSKEMQINPLVDFSAIIKPDNRLTEFFNLPLRLLVPIQIAASLDAEEDRIELSANIPYLQQGRDKLIYDTRFSTDIDGKDGELRLNFDTTFPAKKGDVSLSLNMHGEEDSLSSDLRWESLENPQFKGLFSFNTQISRSFINNKPEINIQIKPSKMSMGSEEWFIAPANLKFADKILNVEGFRIWHDDQFVQIEGKASESFNDILRIELSDIDVDYIFDTLKINYVTFGGEASGSITGSGLFSRSPSATTEKLFIRNLSYNGCVIGDGDVSSHWDNEQMEVAIDALIFNEGHKRVEGHGGVWLKADSLCFDIKADKVPVGFIQPFMKAFSSDIGGFASGDVRLAGNFHDIDLTGVAFADSVNVKLDYTQTYYHGSDSIFLRPGRIEIPGFRLYDRYGHSALFSGELTHKYFHEPAFTFKLSEAEELLCYDTTSSDNPDWYGTVYGTGGAVIKGEPGYVDINIDMSLVGNSRFSFVLNETQAAAEYNFLTFTDKKKEEMLKAEKDTVMDFKTLFKKEKAEQVETPTSFDLGIRATVTPSVLFTLVMDPKAGDKITAKGTGAIQVGYSYPRDKMTMFGKYTIEEGNYNFSLQDLILRDFKIIPGSYIVFNGDPLDADLDISAAYRVNTNLSDLDKSFQTDRDLTRTNVPVDAILKVDGHMTRPNITFDIDLPTLTSDVKRKVKSIISTDDMMSRQVIYLLALNRFYTPEYMGSASNGGELSAIASSTLSSQLSNMLGQLTDKFSVAPSFRTDKGDFSDLEFDIALSSRLLNNRLLLNGNFGYRDKSTSTTTFVGDFDLEYLLNRNGNLRLKAYNHFNDQNYYLREALTTQGLGIIYRKDFDNPFDFLKKKKKGKEEEKQEEIK